MSNENMNWPRIISALISRRDLTEEENAWAMEQILSGRAEDAQIAAFLIGLQTKGESSQEINSLLNAMLQNSVPCDITGEKLDIVGTGGDGHNTVNISTMSAVVAAAAGATVVKHGNRAASSTSGSADVIEILGIRIDMPPQEVAHSASEVGLAYCFAQTFHPSLRHAAQVRRTLGVPTVFNVLGPLANPANATAYAIGASKPHLLNQISEVLAVRGARALVFMGSNGLDELCAFGENHIREVRDGSITEHTITASDVDLPEVALTDLKGTDAQGNAGITKQVLTKARGTETNETQLRKLRSIKETVVLNTAAGLVAYDTDTTYAARPLNERIKDKISVAREAISSGAAEQKLRQWIEFSHRTETVPFRPFT